MTALDWTDFDADNQSTIVLSMITSHGRATPLLWKTVLKSELAGWLNEHEDVLLERFREVLPEGEKVTVLAPADRVPSGCLTPTSAPTSTTGERDWTSRTDWLWCSPGFPHGPARPSATHSATTRRQR